MNKTTKTTLLIAIVGLVAILGYFFVARKTNVFSPTPKVPASISFQEIGGGCSNIFVYKINSNNTAGISVYAIKEKLNLSTMEKTFEIGKTDGLSVEILIGDKIKMLYCNDAVDPNQPKSKKLIGKTGKAIISISKIDESQSAWNRNYTTTVILKDVRFVEENGNDSDITVDELIFRKIRVGWLPG
ncbi:hypothetical protein A2422_00915 [Candidatus Woesebacteria bacterium RIFOXYC1_FULL_31_51]|uniref:Uncharacterized protein n=1 Tax=Candidatus Woesebacteria bacterium GW2011_GWC2_31_9 TaxID=1618586 RepID=A0A0G0BK75_9BACT|nr:MAG: hypothetical protein UR17_C0001G0632 [Candidatus Woesebacteria bacterium GW2011_GWF1_31_35]KKP22753.1 MAG: hypothetical protein UR11_C0002G0133 [Candidatus Woesebacteria bacterium GW2011_GWC1_30_29]KKP25864.1 MAG: hypothetical protein UR13_C0006G0003 [Candidatus Woesebacteria bacterium GW2011_GWD1_31_12]KKP28001.1 MAG: hypothetical protein UR16_C0001G0022 [Candidatus Woesebacteria bacterium GW2011_GWB1_31_29]KKP30444.1 MAG: hypothetical protein UR20_C0055G0010 [Candidatus Woesebacteria 